MISVYQIFLEFDDDGIISAAKTSIKRVSNHLLNRESDNSQIRQHINKPNDIRMKTSNLTYPSPKTSTNYPVGTLGIRG